MREHNYVAGSAAHQSQRGDKARWARKERHGASLGPGFEVQWVACFFWVGGA